MPPPILQTRLRAAETCASVLSAQAMLINHIWKMRTGRSQTASFDLQGASLAMQSVFHQRIWDYPIALPEPDYPTVGMYPTKDGRHIMIDGGYPLLRNGFLDLLECSNSAHAIGQAILKWDAATLEQAIADKKLPGVMVRSQKEWLSMFGNPNYWKPRMDFFSSSHWNSLNDVEPMKKTLAELIDFDRLNNADLIKIGIVATNTRTGEGHSFMNGQKKKLRLEHILASGALPPSFAPVEIDHHHYWDGGLVDNTPALTLCRMLTEKERQSLPIFCIDLFPEHGPIPKTLHEVQHRMLEIQYENRLNGPDNVVKHAHDLIRLLSDKLPANSEIRKSEPFKTLQPLLALENLHSVGAPHMPMTGGMDFSAHGIKRRHDIGYRVMEEYLEENKADILKKAA